MMKKYFFSLRHILFFILIILLALPFVQGKFDFIKLEPLKGAVIPSQEAVFSLKDWMSGDYQEKTGRYLNENFGFRNFFVRLNNQVAFNLFNTAKANGVIIGKDKVLFQKAYIDSYFGNDFVGENKLKDQVRKFKIIQEELLKLNKYLIFVFAPGKASVYPEYIPDEYFKQGKKTTNYDILVREMKNNNVAFIDFKDYLIKEKSKIKYPVFPRCGTHWSGYVATLVMDSLVKYFETISNIDFVDFESKQGFSSTNYMRFTDSDIGDAMNLLIPIDNWKMYYPSVNYSYQPKKKKPHFLFIGDSFTQSLYKFYPYFEHLFGDQSAFWGGYNMIYWPDSLEKRYIAVKNMNKYDEIMKRDFVVIVATEINLNNFSFNFNDEVYPIFCCSDSINYWKQVDVKESEIWHNGTFLESVKNQAAERNIPVEQNVYLNAKFIVDNDLKNKNH